MPAPVIITVVGNRPQYIKAAALSPALRARVREVLLDTGQHYDHELAGVFFQQLDLPEPDVALGVGSGTHAEQTGRILVGVERAILDTGPELVLVFGDTNSTLAAGLAAVKLHVPVAHVESGLRSFDRRMPEEVNRVLTDRLSSLLFCPTPTAVENLRREGIVDGVHLVGDVMFDLSLRALTPAVEAEVLDRFGLNRGEYVFVTLHRPANADDPARLEAILGVLDRRDEQTLFAAHPRTRATLERSGLAERLASIRMVDPVGYLESLALIRNARVVVTDSGGMQKEAFCMGTPCITTRDTSEWVETLESGWNVLVDADPAALTAALEAAAPAEAGQLCYGEGDAGERIAGLIAAFLGVPGGEPQRPLPGLR